MDELKEKLEDIQGIIDSFLNGKSPADVCADHIKGIINDGKTSIDKEAIAGVIGKVVKTYLLDSSTSILKSNKVKNLINQYGQNYNIDEDLIDDFISKGENFTETLDKISSALGNILEGIDLYTYADKFFTSDNAVDALDGLLGIAETISDKIPLWGTYIGVEICVARKCLKVGSSLAIEHYTQVLGMSDLALYCVDGDIRTDVNSMNQFLREKYQKEYGGEYISSLYLNAINLEQKVYGMTNINELNPLELYFFLENTNGTFTNWYTKNVNSLSKVMDAVDDYCKTFLECKKNEKIFSDLKEKLVNDILYAFGGNKTEGGSSTESGNNSDKTDTEKNPIKTIVGSEENDTIEANDYAKVKVYGKGGNDNITGSAGDDELHGGDGDDTIWGNEGNDVLYGDEGNDTLNGGVGDDILYGGDGNDYLYGGDGDDTYVFGRNSGTDIVSDNSGNNVLRFEEGIRAEDIMVATTGDYDITLSVKRGNTQVILKYFRRNSDNRNFTFEFSDGTRIKADAENSPLRNIVGSEGTDRIMADYYEGMKAYGEEGNDEIRGSAGDDEFHGGAGDDTIYGGAGNDMLYGDDGNDTIFGEDGNDMIYGGAGNDYLYGGAGDDTYVFGRNSGTDIVSDNLGNNILRFEEGIRAEDIMVATTGNYDITLSVKGGNTQVILNQFRANQNNQNFTLEFLDGSVWNINTNEYLLELQSEMNTILDNEYNISLNEGSISMTDLGGNDVLSIGENMLNLIFERDGNNLVINSISNDNALTINDWYTSEDYQIETITSGDGYQITNKQVQLLIDEMSSFTSERGISISDAYSDNYAVENIISQMWVNK